MNASYFKARRRAAILIATLILLTSLPLCGTCAYGSASDGWEIVGNTLILSREIIPDYSPDDPAPWHAYADRITSVQIDSGVRVIGAYALADLCLVRELEIPDGVTAIGVAALAGCNSLITLTLSRLPVTQNAYERTFYPFGALFGSVAYENSVPAIQYLSTIINGESVFRHGTKQTVFHLPESLSDVTYTGATLPPYVFSNCSGIRSIRLSGAPTEIPDYAFFGCSSLSFLIFDHPIETVGHTVFNGCKRVGITYPGNLEKWKEIRFAVDYTDDPDVLVFSSDAVCPHAACGWVIIKAPTCLASGERQYVCLDCQSRLQSVVIPAQGHAYVDETIPATCQTQGLSREICMRCGDVLKSEIIPLTAHDCVFLRTEGGKDLYQCKVCAIVLKKDAQGGQTNPDQPTPITDPEVHPTPGDLNEDGRINTRDLLLLRQWLAGIGAPSERQIPLADLAEPYGVPDEKDADALADLILCGAIGKGVE